MLMAAEERKKPPRMGAVFCGKVKPDGTICQEVCKAGSTRATVTWYYCRSCEKWKTVSRPQAG